MSKELAVISGKGGTGKTSIVASFAALANQVALADCDVDAADLHLILEPKIQKREQFSGGSRAQILTDRCTGCGTCEQLCRFDAVTLVESGNGDARVTSFVDPIACEGCGVCAWFCPEDAIQLQPAVNGEWFVSETRCGPMVHAKLGVAEENSGKLVSLVRQEAKEMAERRKLDIVLIDGSPGIGCPVIASITGADLVLVVAEPTLSGMHDLSRAAELTKHFRVPALVCVNKWDLNEAITVDIEEEASDRGLKVAGRVRYDHTVTRAQIWKRSVVECKKDGCAADIAAVWKEVLTVLDGVGAASVAKGP
jgi:MinD superfamily P-loop ATPase